VARDRHRLRVTGSPAHRPLPGLIRGSPGSSAAAAPVSPSSCTTHCQSQPAGRTWLRIDAQAAARYSGTGLRAAVTTDTMRFMLIILAATAAVRAAVMLSVVRLLDLLGEVALHADLLNES
jgi:hypothetical protein